MIGFKAFLNRPRISFFTNIEDGSLLEGMALIRDAGSVIGLHAENDAILRRRKEVLELAGRRDPKSHAECAHQLRNSRESSEAFSSQGRKGSPCISST